MTNASQEPISPVRDDDSTMQLARDLHEGVRQLNHATSGPPDLTEVGTAYAVLSDPGVAAHGLGQTITQLNDFLVHEEEAGRLGHDLGEPVAPFVRKFGQALSLAGRYTGDLHGALSEAQRAINALHGVPVSAPERVIGSAAETAAEDFPLSINEVSVSLPPEDHPRPQAAPIDRRTRRKV
ncbi:hypothetical protein [Spirillospora sp. NPDC047279]|uniref:hypothetical protein n=1 Tax=Spirillospora sp. NPDC047279 TaxID=3155478 RepID=UPI0033E0EE8E